MKNLSDRHGSYLAGRLLMQGGLPRRGGVFFIRRETRLSDILRQRLHKAIHCLVEAQPTDRPPQSSRKIGLREAGRLAELRKSPGLPSPSADRHDAGRLSASVSRVVWPNPSGSLARTTSSFRVGEKCNEQIV